MERKKRNHREIIALSLIKQLGNRRIFQLLNHFETPCQILTAEPELLQHQDGVGSVLAGRISEFNQWKRVDRVLRATERSGAELLGILDPDYPELLRQIADPPPLLWVRGDIRALNTPGLAVVGTRSPNRYGRDQARKWSRQLSEAGLTLVSGLAYGVDTIAHTTAVETGGLTTAVLGSGIDRIYPPRNRRLAVQIVENGGAVISEFLPDSDPQPGNFPIRNRVVSGLAMGLLIVQSGVKGGSMISARLALDQNREVFAIPHALGYQRGEGNNSLIKSSEAKLVQTKEDVLEELPFEPVQKHTLTDQKRDESFCKNRGSMNRKGTFSALTPVQRDLCKLLEDGRMHLDILAEQAGLSTGSLLGPLLNLELEGLVVQHAGKYFELK